MPRWSSLGCLLLVRHAVDLALAALAALPRTWRSAIDNENSLAVHDYEPFRSSVKGLSDIVGQYVLIQRRIGGEAKYGRTHRAGSSLVVIATLLLVREGGFGEDIAIGGSRLL